MEPLTPSILELLSCKYTGILLRGVLAILSAIPSSITSRGPFQANNYAKLYFNHINFNYDLFFNGGK